jgi:Na+/melibiose symporter-like transporter
MDNNTQRLTFREKAGYGFGDLASVLYWQTFMLYFTYFYTDVYIIPLYIAATMFLISRGWDALFDPVVGMYADRTETKWGKFRPYLLWFCIPFTLLGVLTFTVPAFGMTGKIVWAYVTFVLIMMLYSAINIPYTSLLGVISADSKERTSVSSIKFVFAFAAGIIVSASLLPMAKTLGKGDNSIIQASVNDSIININEVKKGNAKIIISATNSDSLTSKYELGFRVDPAESNLPEIKSPLSTLQLTMGFKSKEIDITDVFKGKNPEKFKYSVNSSKSDVVSVKLVDKKLIIEEKGIGNAKITLTAKDKKWGERTNDFFVNVNKPNNHDPILIDSTNFYKFKAGFKESDMDLSKIVKDPDGDKLSYIITSDNEKVAAPMVKDNMLLFKEGKAGLANVKIIVTDGNGGQLVFSKKYLVAKPSKNPPYFIEKSMENVIENEGFKTAAIDISKLFFDTEGRNLKYKIEVINEAKGWQRSFIIYGIAALIFFLIAFKSTRERVHPPKSQNTSVGKDLYNLVTNKPWLILLATTITFILFVAVRSSVTVHYFKYIIGNQEVNLPFLGNRTYDFVALTSAYNTIGQISSLIGAILVAYIAKWMGKKKAFVALFVIAIFSTGILYFLTAEQLGLIFFFQIVGSMSGGPLSVLIWAMYADTADYGEWKRGTRSTGLIFSASTMSQKFGWAFGAFLALNLMSQLGFQPNEAQSASSLRGLLLLFSLIPAAIGVLSIFISIIYPLNDKRVKEIETELIERRKQQGDLVTE